ncbi:MAG: hypothetical protein ACFCU6_15560, partial [Balneolaceae bacterium]
PTLAPTIPWTVPTYSQANPGMNHTFEITPELLNQIESKYPGTNLMQLQNRDLNFYVKSGVLNILKKDVHSGYQFQ